MLKPASIGGMCIEVAQDVPVVISITNGDYAGNGHGEGVEVAYITDDELLVQNHDGCEVAIPLSTLISAIQMYGLISGNVTVGR